jgi:hypothetical protein
MQDLAKNPRVGFRIYDPEGEAIYYMLGKGVHQVMCMDKKPKNRQRLNPRIGQIVDGVYQTTRPAKDHIFRNHHAWGISKFLVNNAEAFGFSNVQYTTPHGVGTISIAELVFTIDRKEVWEKQAGYEPQYLITPEELGIEIKAEECKT